MRPPEAGDILQKDCHLSQDKENLVSTESKGRRLLGFGHFINSNVYIYQLLILFFLSVYCGSVDLLFQ